MKKLLTKRFKPISWQLILYITFYFWATILGKAFVHDIGYKELTSNPAVLDSLIKKDIVVEIPAIGRFADISQTKIYKTGHSKFSSQKLNYGYLFLSGFPVPILLLTIGTYFKRGIARGLFILIFFVLWCLFINCAGIYCRGIRIFPDIGILLSSAFGGALFWWIDTVIDNEYFDKMMIGIRENMDKLKIIYEHTEKLITLVMTLFGAISIALAWNAANLTHEVYSPSGLDFLMANWIIWIAIWGSLGLLGGICAEYGKRMTRITEAIRDCPMPLKEQSDKVRGNIGKAGR